MTDLTPTSGKTWRAGVTLRLPSGRVAALRAVGPEMILGLGRIPDALTPVIAALMNGDDEADVLRVDTIEDLQARTELMNAVCKCALVNPRIVDEPTKDNEITLDDLDWHDKQFISSVLMKSTRDLELFRDQQERVMDAVQPATDDAPVSESAAEPAPVGA